MSEDFEKSLENEKDDVIGGLTLDEFANKCSGKTRTQLIKIAFICRAEIDRYVKFAIETQEKYKSLLAVTLHMNELVIAGNLQDKIDNERIARYIEEIENHLYRDHVEFREELNEEIQFEIKASKSAEAKKRINARHSQPGGSRDKRQKVLEMYATGKYKSKDNCAIEAEKTIGISFATARAALKGAKPPDRNV